MGSISEKVFHSTEKEVLIFNPLLKKDRLFRRSKPPNYITLLYILIVETVKKLRKIIRDFLFYSQISYLQLRYKKECINISIELINLKKWSYLLVFSKLIILIKWNLLTQIKSSNFNELNIRFLKFCRKTRIHICWLIFKELNPNSSLWWNYLKLYYYKIL